MEFSTNIDYLMFIPVVFQKEAASLPIAFPVGAEILAFVSYYVSLSLE